MRTNYIEGAGENLEFSIEAEEDSYYLFLAIIGHIQEPYDAFDSWEEALAKFRELDENYTEEVLH